MKNNLQRITIDNVDDFINYTNRNSDIKQACQYDGPLDAYDKPIYMYFDLVKMKTNNSLMQNMWVLIDNNNNSEHKKYCFLSQLYKNKNNLSKYLNALKQNK